MAWLEHVGVSPPIALLVSFTDVNGTHLSSMDADMSATFDRKNVLLPPLLIGPGLHTIEEMITEATTLVWQATGRFHSPR